MIQAQRQLEARVKALGGDNPPQPHYAQLMNQLGGVVSAKEYLQSQLILNVDVSRLPPIPAGASIDPLAHGVYTSKSL